MSFFSSKWHFYNCKKTFNKKFWIVSTHAVKIWKHLFELELVELIYYEMIYFSETPWIFHGLSEEEEEARLTLANMYLTATQLFKSVSLWSFS